MDGGSERERKGAEKGAVSPNSIRGLVCLLYSLLSKLSTE